MVPLNIPVFLEIGLVVAVEPILSSLMSLTLWQLFEVPKFDNDAICCSWMLYELDLPVLRQRRDDDPVAAPCSKCGRKFTPPNLASEASHDTHHVGSRTSLEENAARTNEKLQNLPYSPLVVHTIQALGQFFTPRQTSLNS